MNATVNQKDIAKHKKFIAIKVNELKALIPLW